MTREELLEVEAAVEAASEHPLADAILTEAHARGITVPPGQALRALAGVGVEATVDGQRAFVGKPDHAISPDDAPAVAGRLADLEAQSRTAVLSPTPACSSAWPRWPTSCARRPPARSPNCTSSASTGW